MTTNKQYTQEVKKMKTNTKYLTMKKTELKNLVLALPKHIIKKGVGINE